MRKVIDGLIFDSEEAELVTKYENGFYPSEFKYLEETLYRTSKGAFFIHGEGGAATEYARPIGDGSTKTNGEDLRYLTPEEVLGWLELRGIDPTEVEKYIDIDQA